MQDDEGFVSHVGADNPIRERHGAIVKLRSGKLAIVTPKDHDGYDLDFETIWFQTGAEDDIVAYKQTPMLADEIVREIEEYLRHETALVDAPIKEHPLMKLASANRLRSLNKKLAEYKKLWPNNPALIEAVRLTEWRSED